MANDATPEKSVWSMALHRCMEQAHVAPLYPCNICVNYIADLEIRAAKLSEYTRGKKDGQEKMREALEEIHGHMEYCLKGNHPIGKRWILARSRRALDLEE